MAGDVRFSALSVGGLHACGLTGDGAAHCWGFNGFGELGDGTIQSRLEPTPVAGDLTFTSLAAGSYRTCGVTTADELLCWGRDPAGAIAGAGVIRRMEPTAVGGATPQSGG